MNTLVIGGPSTAGEAAVVQENVVKPLSPKIAAEPPFVQIPVKVKGKKFDVIPNQGCLKHRE